MSQPHKLAEHVRARTNEARIERQWSAIEQAGLPADPSPRMRRAPWVAAGLLLAVAGAAAALLLRAPASLPPGALVESARAEVAVQLDDGSRVELSPESQLRLLENRAGAVALELRSGSARFRVKRDRARPFRVNAGRLEVRVIGTRFELTRTPRQGGTHVTVTVTEGVVELRRLDVEGAGAHRIGAGESWSALIAEHMPAEAVAAAPAVPEVPAQPEDALEAEVEVEPVAGKELHARGEQTTAKRGDDDARDERSASAVFRHATLARRAGRMDEAAAAYADLLAHHPADARAGVSAFELGRIRMDALDDHTGAIQALERALATGSGASFHEDALARIVVATDALGRGEACRKARARYLERYPNGVHANALAARCR